MHPIRTTFDTASPLLGQARPPTVVSICACRLGRAEDVLVVLGGTIPDEDDEELKRQGVAAVFGPGASTTDIVAFLVRAAA